MEGQIKNFPDKKELKEFIITKPLLYEMLKGLFKKKVKTINNKMTINTYLLIIESKIQKENIKNKKNRDRIMDRGVMFWNHVLMVARWEGVWGNG